ncbi:MAG: hypothetical protein PHI34_01620 [Acidobacteriota bacterium]|nr:hypothetical protein [Acidobacteriota bacterium]
MPRTGPRSPQDEPSSPAPKPIAARAALGGFFLFCLLFQVFIITQGKPLYGILRVLFFAELGLVAWAGWDLARRHKAAFLVLLLVVGVRLPFFFQSDGLLFMTDNALEAVQSLQIQDSHTAPAVLLGSIGHNGVIKHLMVAFLWDVTGRHYLVYPIFQTVLYLVFLAVLFALFGRYFDRRASAALLIGHFACLEVFFDYSLFLRAGPYFEMLLTALIGAALFDFEFKNRPRLFLSLYFLAFSLYINQAAAFFVLPFLAAAGIVGISKRAKASLLPVLAGGLAVGAFLPIYRMFFVHVARTTGSWFHVKYLPLSDLLRPARIPAILGQAVRDFVAVFRNLIGYEFRYAHTISPSFRFEPESEAVRTGLGILYTVGEILFTALLAAGIFLAARALRRGWRDRRQGLPWIPLYFFLQLAFIFARLILMNPMPFVEPRHNLDLALLLVLSAYWVVDALIRSLRWTRAGTAGVVLLSLLLGLPSTFTFYKTARFKRASYEKIVGVLRDNGVKYLATDFTIAHVIYFLTGRKIEVTDSIGPVIMDVALSEMTRAVDALPDEKKAYLFFRPSYPRVHGLRERSGRSRDQLIRRLRDTGIRYRDIRLEFYELIIPEASRLYAPAPY